MQYGMMLDDRGKQQAAEMCHVDCLVCGTYKTVTKIAKMAHIRQSLSFHVPR